MFDLRCLSKVFANDRFGRIKDQRWDDTDATPDTDRYQYGYDEAGNRLYRANPVATAQSVADRDWLYAYESSHRLDNAGWGTLNSGRTALTSTFATQDWSLDALGNWTSFDQVVGGMVDFNQTRTHNKANEVTGLTTTGNAWNTGIAHDAVGNITTMPRPSDPTLSPYTCVYDAWNRLVKVSEGSTTVAEYEYDGLNRRIVKSLGTGTVKEHYYYNENWQELEVRKETSGTESANPLEQFVWHPYYIDALATRFYDSDVSNSTGVVQHYFTHDANYNVTGAVDTSGNVVERYDYSPYGEPIFLDANFDFDADSVSDIAHSRMYTGQRFDAESWLYQYRNRYLHSRLGRFVSRDPIGYEGSKWSLYEYVRSKPIITTDPTGNAIPIVPIGIGLGAILAYCELQQLFPPDCPSVCGCGKCVLEMKQEYFGLQSSWVNVGIPCGYSCRCKENCCCP